MARRRIYPMPVEALYDHPDFIAMPAAGAGIVIRLLLHFWITECRPLPVADHELRAIGRVHTPTWRHWKAQAMTVVEALAPDMRTAYQSRVNGTHGLRISGWKRAQAKKQEQGARAMELARSSLEPLTAPLQAVPRRDPAPQRPPTPATRAPRPMMADRG